MTRYERKLARIAGFENERKSDIATLARFAEMIDVAAGDALFGPDDRWGGACVVVSGEAEMRSGGWIARLGAGSRVTRGSSPGVVLTASTPMRVLEIDRRVVDSLAATFVRSDHDRVNDAGFPTDDQFGASTRAAGLRDQRMRYLD
jgi:hypothetical protein